MTVDEWRTTDVHASRSGKWATNLSDAGRCRNFLHGFGSGPRIAAIALTYFAISVPDKKKKPTRGSNPAGTPQLASHRYRNTSNIGRAQNKSPRSR
jgi:hypothetical protein